MAPTLCLMWEEGRNMIVLYPMRYFKYYLYVKNNLQVLLLFTVHDKRFWIKPLLASACPHQIIQDIKFMSHLL